MSGTVEIKKALTSRLVAASPGAALDHWQLTYENDREPGSKADRWYRDTFMPGEPRAVEIGAQAQNRHTGIYQVDIFDPVGSGDDAAADEAERICQAYKRGTVLTYGGVLVRCEKAWVMRINPQPDPAWYQISVRVQWMADVEN